MSYQLDDCQLLKESVQLTELSFFSDRNVCEMLLYKWRIQQFYLIPLIILAVFHRSRRTGIWRASETKLLGCLYANRLFTVSVFQ